MYIYTSGVLVYGDHPDEVVDESTPIHGHSLIQWRIDHEKAVVSQEKLDGIVVRPGFVYGRSGSFSTALFKSSGDKLVIRGALPTPSLHGPLLRADIRTHTHGGRQEGETVVLGARRRPGPGLRAGGAEKTRWKCSTLSRQAPVTMAPCPLTVQLCQ